MRVIRNEVTKIHVFHNVKNSCIPQRNNKKNVFQMKVFTDNVFVCFCISQHKVTKTHIFHNEVSYQHSCIPQRSDQNSCISQQSDKNSYTMK